MSRNAKDYESPRRTDAKFKFVDQPVEDLLHFDHGLRLPVPDPQRVVGGGAVKKSNIPFRSEATDSISGFTGIVTGRAEYLVGTVDYLIEPRGMQASGEPLVSKWINSTRLCDVKAPKPEVGP